MKRAGQVKMLLALAVAMSGTHFTTCNKHLGVFEWYFMESKMTDCSTRTA